MGLIYTPSGRAREYSPLAVNIYSGCNMGCVYCYGSRVLRKTSKEYSETITPKKDFINTLKREAVKIECKEQVLLSIIGDPYCQENDRLKLTRQAIEILSENGFPVVILTKSGPGCLQDIGLFKKYNNLKIGATLTFINKKDSLKYEPNAKLPIDRLKTLKLLHDSNIKTWVSMEPVIDPNQTIDLISDSLDYVDEYRIGKINNYNDIDRKIDWNKFLKSAVEILRTYRKKFYIKKDLQEAGDLVELTSDEKDMDFLNLKFDEDKGAWLDPILKEIKDEEKSKDNIEPVDKDKNTQEKLF